MRVKRYYILKKDEGGDLRNRIISHIMRSSEVILGFLLIKFKN
jgi:hypothetical protein